MYKLTFTNNCREAFNLIFFTRSYRFHILILFCLHFQRYLDYLFFFKILIPYSKQNPYIYNFYGVILPFYNLLLTLGSNNTNEFYFKFLKIYTQGRKKIFIHRILCVLKLKLMRQTRFSNNSNINNITYILILMTLNYKYTS